MPLLFNLNQICNKIFIYHNIDTKKVYKYQTIILNLGENSKVAKDEKNEKENPFL